VRTFRATYKDRKGRTRESAKWYLEFRDHLETTRRLPAFTDAKASEALGRQIGRLVEFRAAGEMLPPDVSKWIEGLTPRLRELLGKWQILEAGKCAALKTLSAHLDDWRAYLTAKGNTGAHVDLVTSRARRVIDACRFTCWSDIRATKVLAYLHDLRSDKADADGNVTPGMSSQTFNFYLGAFKQFCRWAVRDGRASESPVEYLEGLNVRTDRRHDRRALTVDEARRLIDATAREPNRFGMTGQERATLYRVAIETGLRANELRSLTRGSFDLEGGSPAVTVAAAYSKHRREDRLPLRADTAAMLKGFFALKTSEARAFHVLRKTAKMLKADLKAAGIPYKTGAGLLDFHSLRHTAASLLAAAGVHPKTAQQLMRHSDINLTLSRYTHSFRQQESAAVESLPDLAAAPERQAAVLTGTDAGRAEIAPVRGQAGHRIDADGAGRIGSRSDDAKGVETRDFVLASCLASEGGFRSTKRDGAGRPSENSHEAKTPINTAETASSRRKTMAGVEGLEPPATGFGDRCSAN